MPATYRVDADGLNLRDAPSTTGSTVLSVLPRGHRVEKLGEIDDPRWWHVATRIGWSRTDGFVASRYLSADGNAAAPDTGPGISADDLFRLAADSDTGIVNGLVAPLNQWLPLFGISDTSRRLSHFLAQAAHETDGLRTLIEYGSDAYFRRRYGKRTELGNLSEEDGPRFKGRGIFQLTGRANYRNYGARIGEPLERRPELAAAFEPAVRIACHYWDDRGLNTLADRDGDGDFKTITRHINGGYNGLEDRYTYYRRARSIFG